MAGSASWDRVETEVGRVVFAVDAGGALKVLGFARDRSPARVLARALPGWTGVRVPMPDLGARIAAFVAGAARSIDADVAPEGTPFQHRVWAALRAIPYGETRAYGEQTAAVGSPGAARAVGRASGANPIALAIPCHRVMGADGALTGFAAGVRIKARLLANEAPGRGRRQRALAFTAP